MHQRQEMGILGKQVQHDRIQLEPPDVESPSMKSIEITDQARPGTGNGWSKSGSLERSGFAC